MLVGAGALVAAVGIYGGLASMDVQAKMGPGGAGNPGQGQGEMMRVQSDGGRGPQDFGGPQEPGMQQGMVNNNQGGKRGPEQGPRGGMKLGASDQAVSACAGKAEQDACSFTQTLPDGTQAEKAITGTCVNMPRRNENIQGSATPDATAQLICMPGNRNGNFLGENKEQRVQQVKIRKSQEIARIENRVEKIIAFLKTQGVDTATIESQYAIFKTKADALLAKIDAYTALTAAQGSADAERSAGLEAVRTAGREMMDYFKNTLRVSIQSAVDGLTN